jgi:hypothetical protein
MLVSPQHKNGANDGMELVKMNSFQKEMKANQENMDGWVEEIKAC